MLYFTISESDEFLDGVNGVLKMFSLLLIFFSFSLFLNFGDDFRERDRETQSDFTDFFNVRL